MRCKDDQALRVVAYLIAMFFAVAGAAAANKVGEFKGELILKALPDGRNMQLVAPFTYIDSRDVTWSVPAGTRVDGASIPSVFWSIIGAPYTGKYREASVIHDYYCATKSRHWKAVHKVFLDGMLARGVAKKQAELMYLAVYRFGPRWDFDVDACYCEGCPICASPTRKRVGRYQSKYNAEEFEELRQKLFEGKSTLEELEDAADYQLNTEILKPR
jgi:Protein of unknown function (DUF1353)